MKYKRIDKLKEVAIIQPDIFYDYRGEYVETWNIENYKVFDHLVNGGKPIVFKQDDISTSVKHTLRGLHGDDNTWKLVSCIYGLLITSCCRYEISDSAYIFRIWDIIYNK